MDIIEEFETTKAALATTQGELATAQQATESAQSEVAALQSQLADEKKRADECATILIETKEQAVKIKADSEIAQAEVAKLKAEEKSLSERVLEITGKKGGKPAEAVHAAQATNQITRAEFDALDHAERNAFMASKGKSTD